MAWVFATQILPADYAWVYATFESLIEAQETQEVIEKDDDLQECTDIRYLFKEIKLILNNRCKKDFRSF